MTELDKKIAAGVAKIEELEKALGDKPNPQYRGNRVLHIDGKDVNLNVLNKLDTIFAFVLIMVEKKKAEEAAASFLGVDAKDFTGEQSADDILYNLKCRFEVVQWNQKSKELEAKRAALRELRSQQAKDDEAVGDILNSL